MPAMGDYAIPIGIFVIFLIVFYGIIVVHDIPYQIARRRNHPHQDAIHVAGWISLLFLGVIWPFLWIWAALYREDRGWGMLGNSSTDEEEEAVLERLASLDRRLQVLEGALAARSKQAAASADRARVID